ncbi:hypothetical protein [Sphingomonas sp. TREG-RG-20F-R18-01]|uniref:hypothetical protein n=1 Tax=Sphingomonas sp. TREG-RG-20F-R18-01 TaxID=2914982 RepID=UPI001F586908|nr:hypothetical protein [Sphingomonas sp. TREG-RG-20F-R18-01]
MAKVLKTAALVVGAVALVVATAGALAPAFTSAALASVGITASATAIATVLTLTAAALSFGAALLTPKPRILGGDPTKWKADPFAGLPYWVGRTLNSGNIVRRITHGTNNKYETFVTVLSCAGPIQSIDTFFANRTTQAFDGSGNATGAYRNQIYQRMQLGHSPEPAALLSPIGGVPGMDGSSKLSGLAATAMTFAYDSKATIPFTAEVTPAWIGHGVKCYDPRLDSTYPGGAGPCRALDESTYVWSENPFVHAITWCIGRWQNGKRVIGLGAPIGAIDMPAMVAGANLADANNWKVGGVVYSRPDTPWTVLKAFLQAAAAIPVMVGGSISCMAETPRVSLATISSSDIVGEVSLTATQSRRARINGVVPRYRSEAHDWQVVAGDLVQVADYVTIDGGERTKDVEYVLVQDVGQATQLGRYEIENAREFGPVTVQLKPAWMNYRVGDCVTLAPREITPQKMLILSREVDPATGIVTFTMRSETDGKHAYALGQTGVAPPTATLNPYVPPQTAPAVGAWSLIGGTIVNDGQTAPALIVNGACEVPNADGIIFEYRVAGSSSWIGGAVVSPLTTHHEIGSVTPLTSYEVAVSYRSNGMIGDRLVLPAINTGATGADWTRITDSDGTKPANNATNSADPNSPFGSGTVGGTLTQISNFDTELAAARAQLNSVNDVTIPAINKAVSDAGDRITAAKQSADDGITAANTKIDGIAHDLSGAVAQQASVATALAVSAGSPTDFTMRGLYYGADAWQGQSAQLPDMLFNADGLGGYHYLNATSGGSYSVALRHPLPFAGKIYRYQAMIRAVGADGSYSADYEWSSNQTAADGGSYAGFTALAVSAGWLPIDYLIDGSARSEVWLNPHLRGGIGPGGKIEIAYFRCLDVTTAQSIGAVNARVGTVEQASQDRDKALGQRIDSVAASGGYDDTAVYAEVHRVDQAAIDRDSAIGQSIASVTSGYQNGDTATNARVDQVATTASNAAQSVSDLSTSVNTRFGYVNGTLSSYNDRITTLSTNVQGYANRTGTLEATVGPADGSKPPLTSRVTSAENAIANFPQNYAAATRASDLEAQVNGTAPSNLLARANDQASVIADGKVGAVAQSLANLTASLTPPLANLGSSFPSWPEGQAAPMYWTVWAGTNTKVSPGLVGAFSVRNDVTRGAGAGLSTDYSLDAGMAPLKGDAAYLLRGDLTLLSGGLRGAGILVQGLDANGAQVAEVKFAFNTFETSPGNAVGNGSVGNRYVFKRAVSMPPAVAKLRLFMISDWFGFDGDSVTKSLLWHECGIRLGTDVDTVSAQIATQAGALAGPGGASVAWSVTGTTTDGSTMIQLSKRDGSAGQFYINANVLIDGNLLVNGTVTTRVVAPNAITQWATISGSSGEVDAGASPAYSDPLTIVTQGGLVKIDCSFDASNGSGTGPFFFVTLQRDGGDVTRQFAVRTTGTSVPNFFTISDTPPAGSHSYRLCFGRSASGSAVMQFSSAAIFVQEFKR